MGKLVIGGSDDGCKDYYCTSCKSRFQMRYHVIQYCPICGERCTGFIQRTIKEHTPSGIADEPIQLLHWEIVQFDDRALGKVVYQTNQWDRTPRHTVYARLKELQAAEKEAQDEWKTMDWPKYTYKVRRKYA